MYKKAIQTPNLCAFAYEVSMGGYALTVVRIGDVLILDDEPQFDSLQSLEAEMQELAPLAQWSKTLFERLIERNQVYL